MAKRFPIQKAKVEKGSPLGKFGSLKMDGMHVIWDGGITRGMSCEDVPFANPNAAGREATGLWTQYLNPVTAPDWWLDAMPRVMGSGELWAPDTTRDKIMGCKRHVPSGDIWDKVKFNCFTLIPPISFFNGGQIDLPHCKVNMDSAFHWFMAGNAGGFQLDIKPSYTFYQRLFILRKLTQYPSFKPVDQWKIDQTTDVALLKEQLTSCHDGLVFAKENALWCPTRSDDVTKDKDSNDSEAVIIGINDAVKNGTWDGLVGSLQCRWLGLSGDEEPVEFALSGMNRAERQWGYFNVGDTITFRYREINENGMPMETRYWRKR
jgi:hypothetical protein